jgi:hypothetical protein
MKKRLADLLKYPAMPVPRSTCSGGACGEESAVQPTKLAPHLGAATTGSAGKRGLRSGGQMSDYLLTGAVTTLNMPSVAKSTGHGSMLKLSGHPRIGSSARRADGSRSRAIQRILYDTVSGD